MFLLLCPPAASMIAGCSRAHCKDCASALLHGLAGEGTATDAGWERQGGQDDSCEEHVELSARGLHNRYCALQLLHHIPHTAEYDHTLICLILKCSLGRRTAWYLVSICLLEQSCCCSIIVCNKEISFPFFYPIVEQ